MSGSMLDVMELSWYAVRVSVVVEFIPSSLTLARNLCAIEELEEWYTRSAATTKNLPQWISYKIKPSRYSGMMK